MPSPNKPVHQRTRRKNETPAARLHALGRQFLERSWELFPEHASALGIESYNGGLSLNDPKTHAEHHRLVVEVLRELEEIPDDTLGRDDWLDRRGLLAMLRTEALFGGELSRWRRNPQVHPDAAVESIFDLVVRNADQLRKVLPEIESRLRKIPDYLAAGLECVRRPVPLWTDLAAQSCEGAAQFMTELADTLVPLSENPSRCRRLCTDAARAFQRYARDLSRKSSGESGGFAVGEQAFGLLARERTGLRHSPAELAAQGRALVEVLRGEVATEARKFGRGTPAEIIEKFRQEWEPDGETLLDAYRKVTTEMRGRMLEANIVSLPKGEVLKVLPVPSFLKHHFPTAAYSQPPAYARRQQGIFWVNDLSKDAPDEKGRRAEVAQHFGLELTCAHEGYPGHHLQFFIQNRHPSKLRRLFHHAIYYEGWTLWCEKLCIEHGLYDKPYARLIQLHDALWRACRIVIDCGIHTGSLTLRQARTLLMNEVGFTKRRADTDLNWYTSAPTVPMSYLLGRLELERLHHHKVRTRGWGLRQFNDWILSFGAIPWSWIWEAELRG